MGFFRQEHWSGLPFPTPRDLQTQGSNPSPALGGQFFLFLKKIFNWRIIALQNFVVFCHTSTRIKHKYTHVLSRPALPPISLPIPPFACRRASVWVSWVIQQIPIGDLFYVWCCKFLSTLFIHLPFCLLSSHCVHRSVLYVCFSVAALKINSSVASLQILYICVSTQYLYFSFWLTSLSIIGSSFIHLTRTDSKMHSFSWLSSIPLHICTTASLSIHLLMDI